MVMIGVLLGLAVGCKMTSGVMIALPVAAVLLARGRVLGLLLATVVAVGVYSPWAIRSMVETHTPGHIGNPVFPIAAERLGLGNWTVEQAERWTRGHQPPPRDSAMATLSERVKAVGDEILWEDNGQWSPNYVTVERWSGVGSSLIPAAGATNIVGRLGWLWFVFPIGLAAALSRGRTAWRLLLILGVQLAGWMFFTHLQARFFLPGVIPVALLLALGAARVAGVGIVVGATVALQALMTGFLLLPSPKVLFGPHDPLAGLIDIPQLFRLPDMLLPMKGGEPVTLPEDIRTYLIGDATAMRYHGTVLYHTVWDIDPLVEIYKKEGAEGAMKYLRGLKVDYVVVNWSEIERLRATYGFDAAVAPEMFMALEKAGLVPVGGGEQSVLYQVK
jgi:hypothetical protein